MFFWRIKDLGTVPGYETCVAPMDVAQKYAMRRLEEFIDGAKLPKSLDVTPNAFHISPGKGLVSASRYARHVVVGSRGSACTATAASPTMSSRSCASARRISCTVSPWMIFFCPSVKHSRNTFSGKVKPGRR